MIAQPSRAHAQLQFQNGKNYTIVKEGLGLGSDFVQCQGAMTSSIPGPCVIVVALCSQEKFLPDDLFGDVGRDLCHCTHEAQTQNVYIHSDMARKTTKPSD